MTRECVQLRGRRAAGRRRRRRMASGRGCRRQVRVQEVDGSGLAPTHAPSEAYSGAIHLIWSRGSSRPFPVKHIAAVHPMTRSTNPSKRFSLRCTDFDGQGAKHIVRRRQPGTDHRAANWCDTAGCFAACVQREGRPTAASPPPALRHTDASPSPRTPCGRAAACRERRDGE